MTSKVCCFFHVLIQNFYNETTLTRKQIILEVVSLKIKSLVFTYTDGNTPFDVSHTRNKICPFMLDISGRLLLFRRGLTHCQTKFQYLENVEQGKPELQTVKGVKNYVNFCN